jgi:hypothetical protein
MAMSTYKANADAHPGLVVLNSQSQRHTRCQIKEDEAFARVEAIAIEEDAVARHHAVIERIAELEDYAQREEETRKKYGNRPDLRHHTVKGARVILKLPSRKATHPVPLLDEMVGEVTTWTIKVCQM